jgi:hypothetical protein
MLFGAGITVPVGASIDFGTGSTDLGCGDLVVDGTANGDGATITGTGIGDVDVDVDIDIDIDIAGTLDFAPNRGHLKEFKVPEETENRIFRFAI